MSAQSHGSYSTKPYFVVFAILMILLVVTVAAAYVHLGWLNIPVAMGIATIKAALVIWYFMHVKDSSPLILLSFLAGVVTLLVGACLLMADYLVR